MVLDALGVLLGGRRVDPEGGQEREDDPVSAPAIGGELAAAFGQEDRPVGLALDVAVALQPS
jgi:hypothetical protein